MGLHQKSIAATTPILTGQMQERWYDISLDVCTEGTLPPPVYARILLDCGYN